MRQMVLVTSCFLALFLAGCDDSSSPTEPDERIQNVIAFDAVGNSVAEFMFTQRGSTVSLAIRSLAQQPVSFSYRVDFRLNAAAWTNQGAVSRLPVSGTVDQGTIASNPARIDLGTTLIQLASIRYGQEL